MNYLISESQFLLEQNVSKYFANRFNQNIKVKLFGNSQMAIYDICFSLIHFLSHKEKVAVIKKGTGLYEGLMPQFFRLQTQLVYKKNDENMLQFISQFSHDMNFMLWTNENEITGELLHSDQDRIEIHKNLSKQRIFSIEVKSYISDEDLLFLKESPYTIYIETGSIFNQTNMVRVFTSDKFKCPPLISQMQTLIYNDQTQKTYSKNDFVFKENLQSEFNYFSQSNQSIQTLNDRYVIVADGVAGSALKQKLNLNSEEAFAPSELPLWVIELLSNWWPEAQSQKLVREILVLRKNIHQDKNFFDKINNCVNELRSLSKWSI